MAGEILCWFSAGVTSAVTCKICLEIYKPEDVKIFYFDTGSTHPDNKRFIRECAEWYGHPIITRKNQKYEDHFDVIRKERYINGPTGAKCTKELKKKVRWKIEKEFPFYHAQAFGFEYSKHETNRALRFVEQNPDTRPIFPLIDRKMDKPNCMALLEKAGIQLPSLYQEPYKWNNNNCIGCVKGGMGYWNSVRIHFPEVFQKMSETERWLGRSCIRGTFLDELDPERGRGMKEVMPDCGNVCDVEMKDLPIYSKEEASEKLEAEQLDIFGCDV